MKVFVVSDMEGVSGIVKGAQTTGGAPMYEEGRRLYTEEINAVVRGARAAGATEIVVMDCHGAGGEWTSTRSSRICSIRAASTSSRASGRSTRSSSSRGWTRRCSWGRTARAGTRDGVLDHTVSGQVWQNLWFNGTLVGETGINAAPCGTWGCPVLLVTGDEASCREGKELLGAGLTTVAVKRGLGQSSARMIPAVRARQLIEDGAKRALSDLAAVAPFDPGKPCEIRVEYKTTEAPDALRHRAGVERVDDRTIVSRAGDWWTAWRQFFF